jgi:tetratricopeptide (TPR) repeat protein
MRRLLHALVILLAFGGTAWADDWADCSQAADPDRAVRGCSNIIVAGPDSRDNLAIAYLNRGRAYGDKSDHDQEIADETHAIELNPKLAEAYARRATQYENRHDYDRAISDYEKAIEFTPSGSESAVPIKLGLAGVHTDRGAAYAAKGDYDRAIADYDKSIEVYPFDPGESWALFDRGEAYYAKGDRAKALTDFRVAAKYREEARARLADLGEPPVGYSDWAHCNYTNTLDDDRTIQACSDIITTARDSQKNVALAYGTRGSAYERRGDDDRATADYNKAIELDPQQAHAHCNDDMLLEVGPIFAIQACTNIIVTGRESGEALAAAYTYRGMAYFRKDDVDRAMADYNRAIELDPQQRDAHYFRGLDYAAKRDYDRAIADYDKSIEINPDNGGASYNARGDAHAAKGDYDQAIADYDRAIAAIADYYKSLGIHAPNGSAYYGRGVAYAAKGDPTRALTDFRVAAQKPWFPQLDQAQARIADLEKQIAAATPAAVAPAPVTQAAGNRVALVIGNSAYRNVPSLNNPVNDASLIASALKADGFDITVADNLDRQGLVDALKAFAAKADNADWAVVYFAGHGIEMGGTNYLIPVDAKLLTDRDVELEAVPSSQVMHAIDGAHQLRVVILDACRDNPFAETIRRTTGGGRDIGRGLARIEPARGTLVLYSAKEGTIAADGDGTDSPFATALAKHLTEPGIEVDKMFRLVIDDVFDATGNKQEPFMYGSLPGRQDFYFRPRP